MMAGGFLFRRQCFIATGKESLLFVRLPVTGNTALAIEEQLYARIALAVWVAVNISISPFAGRGERTGRRDTQVAAGHRHRGV